MVDISQLESLIRNKKARIGVIGLGYVGLPVACLLSKAGFLVTGLDIKQDRVNKINQGICPIEGKEPGLSELLADVINTGKLTASTDYDDLSKADIVLIDVETPIDEDHVPQYHALKAACSSLGEVIKDNVLIIVESTIAPGTMDGVVRPLLESSSGKKTGIDFSLGACPERVMPGKLLANLRSMSRVCGGDTREVSGLMTEFYRNIVDADLDQTDLITAELTKTAENAYRDVNIAFANELAKICQAVGADFLQVRDLVNKSPGRNVLLAGAGVGGHCIPKDPWLLAYGAQEKVDLQLIPSARAVNDQMPEFILQMLENALLEYDKPLDEAKVALLGFAYLEESDDVRNSPSKTLLDLLEARNVKVVVLDPYVPGYQNPVLERIIDCDAVVIMVAHQVYQDLELTEIKRRLKTPILVDGRRVLDPQKAREAGLDYYGIGFGL